MWSPRLNLTPAPLALAAMLALGSIPLAQAQTAPTVTLAIAAQPLGQALNELARQANLQLLFAPELVAGKTAPAVSGTTCWVREGAAAVVMSAVASYHIRHQATRSGASLR